MRPSKNNMFVVFIL